MSNNPAIAVISAEEKQGCECPVHPLLRQRRSLRAFSSRAVEPETLRTLLEAARWAPSSMNEQPWSFIVTTQRNKSDFEQMLNCLVEYNVRWAQHAPVLLLSVARLTFESSGEPNRHALHDVGQAIASLTFQANASGLMVCQMAGFDVQKARYAFWIMNLWQLPLSDIQVTRQVCPKSCVRKHCLHRNENPLKISFSKADGSNQLCGLAMNKR
jgi:hypothetical protein